MTEELAHLAGRAIKIGVAPSGARVASYVDDKSPNPAFCRCVYCGREEGLVNRLTRPGDTVVEAGANMGYYTLQLSTIVGPKGRVLAFEPESANFSLLEYNVGANQVKNVDLRRLAVGAKRGRSLLQRSATNFARHSVRRANVPNVADATEVEVVRLDDLALTEGWHVDLLKVDVEGAEADVLIGARRLIEEQTRAVWFEYWPKGTGAELDGLIYSLSPFFGHGYAVETLELFTGHRRQINTPSDLEELTRGMLDDPLPSSAQSGLRMCEVIAQRDQTFSTR